MPLDTNGLRAGQIGAMLVEMQRRGLVPGRGRLNDLPHLMHLPTRNGKTIREELDQGKPLTQIVSENEALRERIAIEDAARISALSAEWSAPVVAAQDLLGFHGNTAPDMRETFDALRNQDNRGRLRVADLPSALRDRFVGVSGKYLIQVYPKENVWHREHQKEFVQQLRTVDPNVTGTPVQLYEYTTLLKRSYEQAALYSLAAISLLVFVHFRSLSSVLLSLLPVAVGGIWLGGLMGYYGIQFNPANIMTLPLVIGIGVTNGIHILNRFAEERTASLLARSTGKAVLVSGLTAVAGFGSLVLARHRGIESLGYVMAIGVMTCMIAGLTFLPALLNLLAKRDRWKKQPSADNARSTLGREEPRKNPTE